MICASDLFFVICLDELATFLKQKTAHNIFLIAKGEKDTARLPQHMGDTPVLEFKQNCKSHSPTMSFCNGLGQRQALW